MRGLAEELNITLLKLRKLLITAGASKPDSRAEYSIGNAIIKEITIDKFLLETQIKTTITIEATGVALIAETNGFIIILKLLKRYDKIDVIQELNRASAKPDNILKQVNAMFSQNSSSNTSSDSLIKTLIGETRRISSPIHIETNCQSNK